jgi:hypothetical protein
MQKEGKTDHGGNHKGGTTKSKKFKQHLHMHVTSMV